MVPDDVLFVSESGIDSPADICKLREIKADAALIGERFMRSADKKVEMVRLRGY
jgi:indole-3-glycerol phosphate synthase